MMSMTRIFPAAALALAVPALAAAQTGPQYTAEEVLEHFRQGPTASADCPDGNCLPKGDTRAVCIGTASECAAREPQTAKAEGFDLLITFEFGSDNLSPQARANLAEFARAMRDPSLAAATFNVDGHTDAVGSDAFNQTLSERRAESVVRYLESLGIDRSRLQAKGHGEADLRDPADPFAGINRRVEATIRTR
jgi:outer membrane protein OmpA-like peptidoglycan-associated protein